MDHIVFIAGMTGAIDPDFAVEVFGLNLIDEELDNPELPAKESPRLAQWLRALIVSRWLKKFFN